ncbi:MAG TPA: type II toxin-antitoxin system YafQ family toxin [Salinimicrobium sp.]|nr:type II toxin-antitoxin system YafQ family toxin [Salinimicrobium sp.]
MSYHIARENSFKKDIKRCKKRNYNFDLLKGVVSQLTKNGKLSLKNVPHKLSGRYKGHWECHIKPDWLLIWWQNEENKTITLVRTGTHSHLFG